MVRIGLPTAQPPAQLRALTPAERQRRRRIKAQKEQEKLQQELREIRRYCQEVEAKLTVLTDKYKRLKRKYALLENQN